MSILFFDDASRESLLPLSFTRPVADFRIGILTIAEKWAKRLSATRYSFVTEEYLQEKFPKKVSAENVFINGSICPDEELEKSIKSLQVGEALVSNSLLIAVKLSEKEAQSFNYSDFSSYKSIAYAGSFIKITYPEDLFSLNDAELRKDFNLLTTGRTSAKISASNTILGNNFFAEEGASAECATFNTLEGPIYLAKNSQVWEGSHIRGSFALGEHSQVKMGGKIYGATTIGPHCRVGGEVNNSILFAYSSKGHEGFLGNSVLGEWCNLGADTNNSNLKNNFSKVKIWDYSIQDNTNTGLTSCGLIMGDHSKAGINTMFNTGTVVGVGANIFGGGFPQKHIHSFTWGGVNSTETYSLDKFHESAEKWMSIRNVQYTEEDKTCMNTIFQQSNQ